MSDSDETLLEFPCDFPIKIFGKASDEFEITVFTIVHKHFPTLAENSIVSRHSKDNTYLALTILVTAESKEQLDNAYRELSAHELVLMAL